MEILRRGGESRRSRMNTAAQMNWRDRYPIKLTQGRPLPTHSLMCNIDFYCT